MSKIYDSGIEFVILLHMAIMMSIVLKTMAFKQGVVMTIQKEYSIAEAKNRLPSIIHNVETGVR